MYTGNFWWADQIPLPWPVLSFPFCECWLLISPENFLGAAATVSPLEWTALTQMAACCQWLINMVVQLQGGAMHAAELPRWRFDNWTHIFAQFLVLPIPASFMPGFHQEYSLKKSFAWESPSQSLPLGESHLQQWTRGRATKTERPYRDAGHQVNEHRQSTKCPGKKLASLSCRPCKASLEEREGRILTCKFERWDSDTMAHGRETRRWARFLL